MSAFHDKTSHSSVTCSAITCKFNAQYKNWFTHGKNGHISQKNSKQNYLCLSPTINLSISPDCEQCGNDLDFICCTSYNNDF